MTSKHSAASFPGKLPEERKAVVILAPFPSSVGEELFVENGEAVDDGV